MLSLSNFMLKLADVSRSVSMFGWSSVSIIDGAVCAMRAS